MEAYAPQREEVKVCPHVPFVKIVVVLVNVDVLNASVLSSNDEGKRGG